jgi:hypothetical protein
MPRFWYYNLCETGVLGVSDYSFVCIIDAQSEGEALAWGHRVAEEYNWRYGLLPHGNRLAVERVPQNGSVRTWKDGDEENFHRHPSCRADQMPDFERWKTEIDWTFEFKKPEGREEEQGK